LEKNTLLRAYTEMMTTPVPTEIFNDDASLLAKIFLSRNDLEHETEQQVRLMAAHPSVSHVRVMPDCHKGAGCCVGFTAQITKLCASPQVIGGDIGCGIAAYAIPDAVMTRKNALEKINRAIHEGIPMGPAVHEIPADVSDEQLDSLLAAAAGEWRAFCRAYENKFDVQLDAASMDDDQQPADFSRAWLTARLEQLGLPMRQMLCSLGTLGGGNHFVEVDELSHPSPLLRDRETVVSEEDMPADSSPLPHNLLVVHSGSRCLGQAIYRYWVSRIARSSGVRSDADAVGIATTTTHTKNEASGTPAAGPKSVAASIDLGDDDVEISTWKTGEEPYQASNALTATSDVAAYYKDMIFAQKFAHLNRLVMLANVMEAVSRRQDDDEEAIFDSANVMTSVHNYIDFTDLTLRKGAVPARAGESVLVALNMRDGVLLARGLGNTEWNSSAAHGCGRVAPRGNALKGRTAKDAEFAIKKFREEMRGVLCDSISAGTFDERPSVYRSPDVVRHMLVEAEGGTVRLRAHYKTVLSAKGAK
jgi:tRNA-splicing ligase RtcB (3'-phosphate/5'-hydroxy nucleic acid ligase)